jgi:hypothetical protein
VRHDSNSFPFPVAAANYPNCNAERNTLSFASHTLYQGYSFPAYCFDRPTENKDQMHNVLPFLCQAPSSAVRAIEYLPFIKKIKEINKR